MATITQLMADIDIRYRNVFSLAAKVVWMNEAQYDLYEDLEIDSAPFNFTTLADTYFYALGDINIDRIKVVNIEMTDVSPSYFAQVPFIPNLPNQYANSAELWYSIVENNMYLNVPSGPITGRNVYIYLDNASTVINYLDPDVEPSTPKRYQELLKLGTLMRIAQARRDVDMQNAFDASYQEKIIDVQWRMKMFVPEWQVPVDTKGGWPNRWGDNAWRYQYSGGSST